jgi:hypothetical protein
MCQSAHKFCQSLRHVRLVGVLTKPGCCGTFRVHGEKPGGLSLRTPWRVDETFINTRPKLSYLYRAVDKYGKTVESLLRPDRGIAAAQAFLRGALALNLPK